MRNAHPTHPNALALMRPRKLAPRFRVPGVPVTAAGALLVLGALSACGASAPDYYHSYDDARSTSSIAAESSSSRSHQRPAEPPSPPPVDYQSGETYAQLEENQFVPVEQDQMATFSLDVDTGSYTIMRRDINSQRLPSPDSVRVEEFVNYFDYGDQPPAPDSDAPFAVHLEGAPSYFGEGLTLLRVGVQGVEIPTEQRPPANLVFLVDVSGSMSSPEKLGLVQFALTALVNSLRPDDTIGIVVYASSQGVLLESTPVANRGVLLEAIDSLRAGGSTNGEAGIRAAYALAEDHFRPGGINRVVLCTDGDFNVGLTGDALIDLIERYRERDITLTTLGFGRGNYNDRDMERLADHGNGNYAFIDGRNEALRVLHEDLQGTLQVIAKDVKVQVVFNPEVVERFRLIGYENRVLAHEDFDNDQIDAAEIGSGQFTTAYLEVALRDGVQAGLDARQLAEVRLRYKEPDGDESRLLRYPFSVSQLHRSFQEASPVFRFGAAVAEYAEILRHSDHAQGARFDEVIQIADNARWSRQPASEEFVQLVASARDLWGRQAANR